MPREVVTQGGKTFYFRDYELPSLGSHDVRLRVRFASPKHGTESHSIRGSAFNDKRWDRELRLFLPLPEDQKPAKPGERGIGNMVVGTVTEVGHEVTRFASGDEVFTYGPIREEHQIAEERVRPLQGLSDEDAVCTDPAHVALVAVRDGNIRVGDDVAVFGLGAIGLLAVQIARVSGAHRVFAVDPIPARRAYAEAHGADRSLDPNSCDVALEIKRATENGGVDVSLETSGSDAAFQEAIRSLRQCGTLVHVAWGPPEAVKLRLDEEFHLNRPTIVGSQAVWENPDRSHPLWTTERARQTAVDLLREGRITGRDLVTPVVTFEESLDALADIFNAPEKTIKVGVRFP